MADLARWRKTMDRLTAEHGQRRAEVARESAEVTRLQQSRRSVEEAQRIAQSVAQAIQQTVHRRIADVVSRCLLAVFDEPYSFKIEFDRKRGKTEAVMVFERGGAKLDDPLNEIGGGVVDVAAFALRLACLLLKRPAGRRMLVLDEPFKCLRGGQNRARTRVMLERLSEELGLQLLICTDIPEYRLGTVVELGDD